MNDTQSPFVSQMKKAIEKAALIASYERGEITKEELEKKLQEVAKSI